MIERLSKSCGYCRLIKNFGPVDCALSLSDTEKIGGEGYRFFMCFRI